MRRELFRGAVNKVRHELLKKKTCTFASMILSDRKMGKLKKLAQSAEEDRIKSHSSQTNQFINVGKLKKRVKDSRNKWRGSGLHGPPSTSLRGSSFVFLGVFLVFLTVLKIQTEIPTGNFDFDGGWYASTLCIVWALTPAPVGQPRQIFAAHLFNMLVGILIQYIPTGCFSGVCDGSDALPIQDFTEWGEAEPEGRFGMPMIWKQALAVALGVSGQAYLGILHPPATGLSGAFAKNASLSWGTVATVIAVDAVVVTMSMLILNLSSVRQYPLFWLGLSYEEASHATARRVSGVKTMISRARINQRQDEAV